MWVSVCKADEVGPGQHRAVRHRNREIVVCRTPEGDLHALFGTCPHRGAPLAFGRLCPLVVSERFGTYTLERTATVLRCPWHAFEFDVTTGAAVADERFATQVYAVRETDGEIQVDV